MAIATIQGGIWLPDMPKVQGGVPNFQVSLTLDAADEGSAFIVRVPKSGNVSKVLWRTGTVTTGATITVRGETLDKSATPAVPSGTLYHANFTGTSVVANADDNVAVLTTLAAAVAVTEGDEIAIVIKNPNASFGNLLVASYSDDESSFPYPLLNTGASPAVSWAGVSGSPVLGLEYDDGSYAWMPGCWPFSTITTTTFNNTTTPDERGNRFRVPFPCRVSACWVWLDADGDFQVNLYDSDGVTKLAGTPLVVDKDRRITVNAGIQLLRFTSTATLLANTYYRLVVEPTSATNLSVYDFTVNTAAVMDAMPGGQDVHLTTAKNPAGEGDWTNTTTRRAFMGIGIDGFDDGAGTGKIARLVGAGLVH